MKSNDCGCMFSLLVDCKNPHSLGVESLGPRGNACLAVQETARLFSKTLVPFCVLTSNGELRRSTFWPAFGVVCFNTNH